MEKSEYRSLEKLLQLLGAEVKEAGGNLCQDYYVTVKVDSHPGVGTPAFEYPGDGDISAGMVIRAWGELCKITGRPDDIFRPSDY